MSDNKRKIDSMIPSEENDVLSIRPLGAGQEVGRSCIMLEFKGKKIMMDCGIHPGLTGMDALPYTDVIEPSEIDILLISHFHLDHCGALPWFLMKTAFRGRCFMTHATKAIYRWLLSDYVKVSNMATDKMLYNEKDIEMSMAKIETINFHEEKLVEGIKFWCYTAGHVLGAAMFMIEIAGVKVLYTGDFSRQEDRHLCAAEIPSTRPNILITEATYGIHVHECREKRENRFTSKIKDIVSGGGRVLIPVFALGRAQELLLILDEFWSQNPDLHEIPIYYASSLAKKCMTVYQTYINAMNDKIKKQIAISNPFVFKHISNLKSIEHFNDIGPSVVMASPGMMQSGLSRELFENWCTEKQNGCIIAGYCVEGTLAKTILNEPDHITSMNGQKLPLNCSVDYISFSAHTDYHQTSEFINILKPPHLVLVHGEANEMERLKMALIREYEDDDSYNIDVHNPKNTQAVSFHFRGEKVAKVVGNLASSIPKQNDPVSGILIKRNFNYHICSANDLSNFTDLAASVVTEKQSLAYSGSFQCVRFYVERLTNQIVDVKCSPEKLDEENCSSFSSIKLFDKITLTHDGVLLTMEWQANEINDLLADSVLTIVLKAIVECPSSEDEEINLKKANHHHYPDSTLNESKHFISCLIETLSDMYGEDCILDIHKGKKIVLEIDSKLVTIDINKMSVSCMDDKLEQMIQTTLIKLHHAILPI